ncbi:MAG: methylated-DNA--[protein]-cysteine S-methyltransferase, partial [Pseudomonadales bacterium]|nr:methylated-DNA--[protein]-cysteine S-methyltransferase [Pseudomonadales bacterium]
AETPERGLAAIAEACGVSRSTLHRGFVEAIALSPGAYRAALRARRLREALETAPRVIDASEDAGFASPSTAFAVAREGLGVTPGTLHRGGRGLSLRWATGASTLGDLVVGWSGQGLCLVEFLEPGEAAEARLRARFPAARIEAAGQEEQGLVDQVLAVIEHPAAGAGLPLDLQGTAFQQRVWAALRTLVPGERLSYTELAERIGRPGAQRAVARACGENPVAVIVPCHRVVGADGALRGYRWGLERKEALLRRESAEPGSVED